jgi:EpsI family protein
MNRRVLAVALVLICVCAVKSWCDRETSVRLAAPLSSIPRSIAGWQTHSEERLSEEVLHVLRADDALVRTYRMLPQTEVQLFVAYYRTQRAGERMHSPRNCLPGSGWEPISFTLVRADVGGGRVENLNRYLVERDGKRLLLIYWYQENRRFIADEYRGKLYLMWDSMRLRRRDGALVRISIVLEPGMDETMATDTLLHFVRSASPAISSALQNYSGSPDAVSEAATYPSIGSATERRADES